MAVSVRERYVRVFENVLGISVNDTSDLRYHGVPEWDSARHMELVAAIEQEFGVAFEPDDILDFASFEKGMELLSKRGGITFE